MMMLFATLVAAIVKLNGFLMSYLEKKEDENQLAELDADDHVLASFSFIIYLLIFWYSCVLRFLVFNYHFKKKFMVIGVFFTLLRSFSCM